VTDEEAMRRAIELAAAVRATTSPNPWVGAVLDGHGGRVAEHHEGPVGEVDPGPLVEPAAVGPGHDPLSVQLPVHVLGGGEIDPEACRPGGAIGAVGVAAAFAARPVAGGERDRLVVEEQEGVVVRLPLLPRSAPRHRRTDALRPARSRAAAARRD